MFDGGQSTTALFMKANEDEWIVVDVRELPIPKTVDLTDRVLVHSCKPFTPTWRRVATRPPSAGNTVYKYHDQYI
jgi:hypothetical protein